MRRFWAIVAVLGVAALAFLLTRSPWRAPARTSSTVPKAAAPASVGAAAELAASEDPPFGEPVGRRESVWSRDASATRTTRIRVLVRTMRSLAVDSEPVPELAFQLVAGRPPGDVPLRPVAEGHTDRDGAGELELELDPEFFQDGMLPQRVCLTAPSGSFGFGGLRSAPYVIRARDARGGGPSVASEDGLFARTGERGELELTLTPGEEREVALALAPGATLEVALPSPEGVSAAPDARVELWLVRPQRAPEPV
jgi:hypothetical protein